MSRDLLKAKALKRGDHVGLVCPSGRPSKPSTVGYCVQLLESMGLLAVLGKNVMSSSGHMAGTDEQRLFDLNDFIRNPEIKGIFCLTGGSGALHLLDGIDYESLRENPKVFMGNDENSAISLAIHKKLNLVTYVGPNVDEIQSKECFNAVKEAVRSTSSVAELAAQCTVGGDLKLRYSYAPYAGVCNGTLIGGSLTTVSSLMGTPYQPDFKESVLFLNDRDERTDILERWFTGLWAAGVLDEVSGVALGSFDDCDSKGSFNLLSVEESLAERLIDLKKCSCFDFPIAGKINSFPVPVGVKAQLDAIRGVLQVFDSALI